MRPPRWSSLCILYLPQLGIQSLQHLLLTLCPVPDLLQQADLVLQHGFSRQAVLAFSNIAKVYARLAVGVPLTGGWIGAEHRHHVQKIKNHPQPKGQGRTYQGEGPRNSAKPGAQRFAGEGAGARKMGGKTNVKGVVPLGFLESLVSF